MNFFQKLFGGKTETPEEKKRDDEARNFDVLKYDGVRALKSGQAVYAIKCFTHALALRDDLETHDYLSQAYIHTGELPQAYEELRKLSEAQPDNQQILIRMANVAYMMEDYGAMASACERALLIDKDKPEVSYLYAQASRGQGDDVNAIAMATRAITLNGQYGDAYLLRGTVRLDMDDVEGAAEDAAWLLEHAAEHEDVLLLSAINAKLLDAYGHMDLHDLASLLAQQGLCYGRLDGYLLLLQIGLMRTDDGIGHLGIVGHIGQLHSGKQSDNISPQT